MPYIPEKNRDRINRGQTPLNVGELNYSISKLVKTYMKEEGLSYRTINDILGALEGAKLEFYRRVAVPYENSKLSENGDIYG